MIEFQSAHPVRGATFFGFRILPAPLFQSTRPVWGATASHLTRRSSRRISIHAPRVGRDSSTRRSRRRASHFNPRAPCGVRPALIFFQMPTSNFNPRTPCGVRPCAAACRRRRGPDFNPRTPCGVRRWIRLLLPGTTNFNPRAPCGARPAQTRKRSPKSLFQSTRPVWGATADPRPCGRVARISIHAPRVGRDLAASELPPSIVVFQSTRPVWGATTSTTRPPKPPKFQSTRPVWGATLYTFLFFPLVVVSIHAPRVGRDVNPIF